mgnify:CR=1 FL=1
MLLGYSMRQMASGMKLDALLPPPFNTLHQRWVKVGACVRAESVAENAAVGNTGNARFLHVKACNILRHDALRVRVALMAT